MSDDRKPLRAAVVGLGSPGRSHMAGYTACPGVQVVAVCDPNAELLARVADDYAVEARYSSYEKMLAGEQIDVVSVATPNHVHADPAVAALNSGMHVLVEKPMARTCAEARLMVDAAERNDRMLEVTFNKRFGSDARVVKAFVDGGGVGEIYHAKSRWLRRSGIPGSGSSWFINKEMSGGGPLIDLGVHMLDLALHIMGEPEVMAVSAATYNKLGQRFTTERHGPHAVYEVEDFATAFIRLSGGRTLALEASWAIYRETGDLMNLVLFGDRGGVEMRTKDYEPAGSVTFYVDAGGVPAEVRPEVPPSSGSEPGHTLAVQQFLDHVRAGNWSDHRGREGLLRTQIIDAIYQSAAQGREVSIG